MNIGRLLQIVLPALLLLLAGPVLAQPEDGTPEDGSAARRAQAQESRKLLEEVLMARLSRDLALEEGQTVVLVKRLAEFRERAAGFRRDRMQLMRSLKQAVRESQDEGAITALLDQIAEHDEAAFRARQEVLDVEGFDLTAWQQARLLIFVNEFEADMRRLLNQAQERRSQAIQRGQMRGGPDRERDARGPGESAEGEDTAPDEGNTGPAGGGGTETP